MMNKIRRKSFIKMGALAMLAPLGNDLLANTASLTGKEFLPDGLMERLVAANDKQVTDLLQSISPDKFNFSRRVGYDFAVLSASYCSPSSQYFKSPVIVPKLEILVQG